MIYTKACSSYVLGIRRFIIRIFLSKKYFRVTKVCTQAPKLYNTVSSMKTILISQCSYMEVTFLFHLNVNSFAHLKTCHT